MLSLWCRECRVGKWVVGLAAGPQPELEEEQVNWKRGAGEKRRDRGPPSPAPIQAAGVFVAGLRAEGEPGLEATTTLSRAVF